MNREFVPYNIAVRLKELGFNEECFGSYYLNKDENYQEGKFDYRGELNIEYSIYKENTYYILAPIYQQAFSFLIPLQDEFKVCLDENGWYIYNLEGQTYSSNALEKLLSTVELNLIVKPDIDIVVEIVKEMENKQTSVNLHQDNDTYNVYIVDEGNLNYHLQHGTIEHTYSIDENNEFSTCQCGRVLHKKSVE